MKLLAVLVILSNAVGIAASRIECKDEEIEALLFINFDDRSEETGWVLNCDGEVLLNTPTGSLEPQEPGSWYSDAVCISETATCMFAISGREGTTPREDSYYALRLGEEEVVVFGHLPNETESFCLGVGCGDDSVNADNAEDTVADEQGPAAPTNMDPMRSPTTRTSRFAPTLKPTDAPVTSTPSSKPAKSPVASPTRAPTAKPTKKPTTSPTDKPTREPTASPADTPSTVSPTLSPTQVPTRTFSPIRIPDNASQVTSSSTEKSGRRIPFLPKFFSSRNFIIFASSVGSVCLLQCVVLFVCCRARRKQEEYRFHNEEVTIPHANLGRNSLFDVDTEEDDVSGSLFENDSTSTYMHDP